MTGAAWLSSARVVRCWVKSRNERNPYSMLPAARPGTHRGLPVINRRKVGTTSSHHGPLRLGLHTCYNGRYKGLRTCESEPIPKSRSKFGLQSATRLHEGGIASNRGSATPRRIRSRALYTPPVTPWKLGVPEVRDPTLGRGRPKASLVTGAKS